MMIIFTLCLTNARLQERIGLRQVALV
uniref:Uncharacterized protein n=1 Tax=Anguilla anguilla TaxID=7936 RepID=A0A0E9P9N5_ANGAN